MMKEFVNKLIERLEARKKIILSHKIIDAEDESMIFAYNETINIVNELAEEYNNGWIPCSERLPDVSGDYLTYVYYDDYENKYYSIEVDEIDCDGRVKVWNRNSGKIVAWQPLPAAWKGVENGKK